MKVYSTNYTNVLIAPSEDSKIAMIDVGTKEYAALIGYDTVRKIHGMRNKRR